MRKKLLVVALLMVAGQAPFAQVSREGHITDQDARPIEGATITRIDGTVLGISDGLGNFVLNGIVPDSLVVSHIAYKDYVLVPAEQQDGPILVVMEAFKNLLDEVEVATGFQQLPRERATGAFSFIDNETFNEQVGPDVISRLEAVANGLDVSRLTTSGGSNMGISIRGVSTFSTGAVRDPLIILDNFPYEGNLDNINPNDVESITLLKDAAAASIWGVKAGNGVIVITTKRAKQNQPIRVEFNSNWTTASKPDLKYYGLMTSKEFIEVERFLFDRKHRFNDTASMSFPAFSPVYEILFRQQSGLLSADQADELIAGLAHNDVRDQFTQYMYEAPVNQQYAFNLQGGNQYMAWLFSAGYDRGKSELSAINNRLTLNVKNTYTPFRNLKLETGMTYVQSNSVSGRTGYSISEMPPYTLLMDEQGRPLPVDKITPTQSYRRSFLDTLGNGKLLDWNYYPLTDDNYHTNRTTLQHVMLNAGADYKMLDWLTIVLKYQYGRQQTSGRLLREEGSYFTRDLINRFSEFDATGNVIYNVPRGSIFDRTDGLIQSHNLRGQLQVSRQWSKHELNLLLGMEAAHRNNTDFSNRTYGYDPGILTFAQVDYLTPYRHLIRGFNNFIPQNHDFNDRTNRFVSTFFNGSYIYGSRYTLSFSGRRDASNLFGVNVNNRWNLLWSAGLGWEASKENFYKSDILPYLRLRTTYGFSGNTDLSRSGVTTIYYSGTSPYFNTPMAYVSQNANPELRWENVRMTNLAIDFRFKGNRLSGSFDFFFKRGTDLFGPDPVDYTTGLMGTITRNVAELKGRGFDLQLSSMNVVRNNWQWNTTLNLSHYDDEVVRYYRSSLNPSSYVTSTVGFRTNIEGERMYAMYSYRWAGLDPQTGDPMGYLGGEVSTDYTAMRGAGAQMSDLINHGSAIPLLFGNLGNTFRYKNWGVSAGLTFKLNYFISTQALRYDQLFQGIPGFNEYRKRWRTPGDEQYTHVPSMVYPLATSRDYFYRLSEVNVQRGDHIRLQYLNLHYNFTSNMLRSNKIRNVRVYLNMANMGIIWKRGDYAHDPLYGYEQLPPSTTYSLGLKISF